MKEIGVCVTHLALPVVSAFECNHFCQQFSFAHILSNVDINYPSTTIFSKMTTKFVEKESEHERNYKGKENNVIAGIEKGKN